MQVRLMAGASDFFFNDKGLHDGHAQPVKGSFERRETERTNISFQNEKAFHLEMKCCELDL